MTFLCCEKAVLIFFLKKSVTIVLPDFQKTQLLDLLTFDSLAVYTFLKEHGHQLHRMIPHSTHHESKFFGCIGNLIHGFSKGPYAS